MAKTTELMQQSLDLGIDAKDILNQGLIPGMDIVSGKMESGEIFIPEVLMAAQSNFASITPLVFQLD
jgi:5-methyltetrahydrofolate--homocysteine methyltransferase